MGFTSAVRSCFQKYATFGGRASRAEYIYWFLFGLLVVVTGTVVDVILGLSPVGSGRRFDFGPITIILLLMLFLPSAAVLVRRLHDVGAAGAWAILGIVPIVGAVFQLALMFPQGAEGENRFGSDPKKMGALQSRTRNISDVAPKPQPSTSAPSSISDSIEQLQRLAKLREDGAISEEEFSRLKNAILKMGK